MKRLTTTLSLFARWMVIVAASLVVLQGRTASATTALQGAGDKCSAECARQCPCCITPAAPSQSSQPIAPVSRTAVERDFQFLPILTFVLALPDCSANDELGWSLHPISSVDAPLYQRHCTYLI